MNKYLAYITLSLFLVSCSSYKRNGYNVVHKNKISDRYHPDNNYLYKRTKLKSSKYQYSNNQMEVKATREWNYLRSLNHTRNFRDKHQPSGAFGD